MADDAAHADHVRDDDVASDGHRGSGASELHHTRGSFGKLEECRRCSCSRCRDNERRHDVERVNCEHGWVNRANDLDKHLEVSLRRHFDNEPVRGGQAAGGSSVLSDVRKVSLHDPQQGRTVILR